MQVLKRDGRLEAWDSNKIIRAVHLALKGANQEVDSDTFTSLLMNVAEKASTNEEGVIEVDSVHRLVENELMEAKLFDAAREYITYRSQHEPDIFRERKNLKPYEYPQLLEYRDAINHSYWLHTEFNYNSDIQDYKTNVTEHERTVLTRAMLAISQVEVGVKKFWGNLPNLLPKPEVWQVGVTFADSEVRHLNTYSFLLELLNMNDLFERMAEFEVLNKRYQYLSEAVKGGTSKDEVLLKTLLFSTFVENVSLFSQFYIVLAFNQFTNRFKGIANGIQATRVEEAIHADFGFDLVQIIKKENPRLWNGDLIHRVTESAFEALSVETDLIEWIFDGKDLPFVTRQQVTNYVQARMIDSLKRIDVDLGLEKPDTSETQWFDNELLLSTNNDFFHKKSTAYNKKQQSFSEEDLF